MDAENLLRIPKMKIVKNQSLVLLHRTFTMHRSRVYSISPHEASIKGRGLHLLVNSKHCKLTRMHSSRMRTARSSTQPGGSPPGTPLGAEPLTRHPLGAEPLTRHTPGADIPLGPDTPWSRHAPGADTPPLRPGTPEHTPPVNRITDTCKNITFPQLRLRAVIDNRDNFGIR